MRYLHSDITTLDRIEIIQDLRKGEFDVLIGINLLREGLDLPEVSLVAVLDADKEGFLRSDRSLIQTCGRAARNVEGKVILYGDAVTRSMQQTIDETGRRREIQQAHNERHGIIPATIHKHIADVFEFVKTTGPEGEPLPADLAKVAEPAAAYGDAAGDKDVREMIREMEAEMEKAAKELAFERAADLRDRIAALKELA